MTVISSDYLLGSVWSGQVMIRDHRRQTADGDAGMMYVHLAAAGPR
jgi:hypothetical protein